MIHMPQADKEWSHMEKSRKGDMVMEAVSPECRIAGQIVSLDSNVQDVPVNTLHACGYISIGCEPCTRAVLPNQHEREGRWWWEVISFLSLRFRPALPEMPII